MSINMLPGIRFEAPRPALDDVLPRMDIALLVGFAERGVCHKPVLIEDAAQFEAQFGSDVALGWDVARNETAWSYLGATVRAFFFNGGQRCWVVRVPHEGCLIGSAYVEDLDGHDRPAKKLIDCSFFGDVRLHETDSVNGLQTQVDFLLGQHSPAHRVQFAGIYALLNPTDMDEVTLIAVPDAAWLGWTRELSTQDNVPSPQSSQPIENLNWWSFLGCEPVPENKLPVDRTQPDRAEFLACGLQVLSVPQLDKEVVVGAHGTFTVRWPWTSPEDVPSSPDNLTEYVLEEARMPDWSDVEQIYVGPALEFGLRGRAVGAYYYRVRVRIGGNSSQYSEGIGILVRPDQSWHMRAPRPELLDDVFEELASFHRALVLVCATRGDCFAVLSLPPAYREKQTLRHARHLRETFAGKPQGSFGGLYHPWLMGHVHDEQGVIRMIPPDGAMCGVMAVRALRRGVWVSPGNEILQGVFRLMPPLHEAQRANLQDARVNVVRQEARGFVVLSADTLADDDHPELRPINVRRLLCLLRRIVLRHGARFVFEPNNDTFRRMVQRNFEVLLGRMFAQGAFAGRTPSQSYQVVLDATVNTPQRMDQGQFFVELRVAPSLPLKFISVLLVQSQDKTVVREGN